MLDVLNPSSKLSFRSSSFLVFVLSFSFLQHLFKLVVNIPLVDSFFSQIDDALVIFLSSIFLLYLLTFSNKFFIRIKFIDVILFLILAIFFSSAFLNKVTFLSFALSFKNYFLFFGIYYFLRFYNYVDEHYALKIIKAISALFIFELFIQIIQLIFAFFSGTVNDDSVFGTFASANDLSYAYFFVLFFYTYLYIFYQQKNLLKYIMAYFLGTIISFGTYTIILFPLLLVLFCINRIFKYRSILRKIIFVILLFLILFALLSSVNNTIHYQDNRITKFGILSAFNPKYLIFYFTKKEFDVNQGSNRLLWFAVTLDRLKKYAYHPLIGMGPGMYASYAAFRLMPSTNKSIYNIFNQLEKGVDVYVDSQIIPIWGELGYLGLGAFVLFFFFMIIKCYSNYKKAKTIINKAISVTATASSLYMLIGMYVNHFIESQTIMLLYIIFISFSEKLNINEKENISKTVEEKIA